MRVLFWYMDEFSWTPSLKTLDDVPDGEPGRVLKAVVAFVHTEPNDETSLGKQVTKLIKQIKWLANKWETRQVVLHSFAHLGTDKSSPEFASELFEQARERLESVDYVVTCTPFGYFNDIHINAPGQPLARIYKAFD
jgi:hypothetical protein